MMKFKNELGYKKKVRFGSNLWKTVDINGIIDMEESQGISYGFSKYKEETKENKGDKPDAEKDINEKEKYFQDLLKINGIGESTAKYIIGIYPTKRELLLAVKSEKKIPIRKVFIKEIKKLENE